MRPHHLRIMIMLLGLLGLLGLGALATSGCVRSGEDAGADDHAEEPAAAPTNRIDIPPLVQKNLGITFATVEMRPVQRTLRLPGQFELTPEARREYHAMLPGRVELLVKQFDRVEAGDALLHIDSPMWRQHQHESVEAAGEIKLAESALAVAEATLTETEQAAVFIEQRLAGLAEANVRNVELEAQVHTLRNRLPRLRAEREAKRVELDEAHEHYASRLTILSSVSGQPIESLLAEDAQGTPRWRTIGRIIVRAEAGGVVDRLDITSGGWVETGDLAIVTVDPGAIRFRASALQSDLSRLSGPLTGRIVPPHRGRDDPAAGIDVEVAPGFRGHAEERTIPLYATPSELPMWARPGVTAQLDLFIDGSEEAVLAVPRGSVIQDGLEHILFRRDPNDANKVIRTPADLGPSDGRWVALRSGVRLGDEVVLHGVYELMLAQGDRATGGHFHADGTFHAEDH